jgi:hypothetical protein
LVWGLIWMALETFVLAPRRAEAGKPAKPVAEVGDGF